MTPVVLHLEDDPALARLVRLGFEHLGFQGEILQAATVADALKTIQARKARGEPLDLILVDMNLPDGTGLDVVRRIKTNPAWSSIPVLVLSAEASPDTVSEAYALGANCYLSKAPLGKTIVDAVEDLYRCWIEVVDLPEHGRTDGLRELLGRGASGKARASRVYARLAESFAADVDLAQFWLGLALNESNHSNLLSFLIHQTRESALPSGCVARLEQYVTAREASLEEVERLAAGGGRPEKDRAFEWALRLEGTFEPGLLAEGVGALFPRAPAATRTFAEATARYLQDLASRVVRDTADPKLRRSAEELLGKAEMLRVSYERL